MEQSVFDMIEWLSSKKKYCAALAAIAMALGRGDEFSGILTDLAGHENEKGQLPVGLEEIRHSILLSMTEPLEPREVLEIRNAFVTGALIVYH